MGVYTVDYYRRLGNLALYYARGAWPEVRHGSAETDTDTGSVRIDSHSDGGSLFLPGDTVSVAPHRSDVYAGVLPYVEWVAVVVILITSAALVELKKR